MKYNGEKLQVTVLGSSHAPAVGALIEGLPAGIHVDMEQLAALMARRAPGRMALTSTRQEADEVEFISGLNNGVTCGAPIHLSIRNKDVRSADYEAIRNIPRPSHADYPARIKYGDDWDGRGGGKVAFGELSGVLAGDAEKCGDLLGAEGLARLVLLAERFHERGIVVHAAADAFGAVPFDLFGGLEDGFQARVRLEFGRLGLNGLAFPDGPYFFTISSSPGSWLRYFAAMERRAFHCLTVTGTPESFLATTELKKVFSLNGRLPPGCTTGFSQFWNPDRISISAAALSSAGASANFACLSHSENAP